MNRDEWTRQEAWLYVTNSADTALIMAIQPIGEGWIVIAIESSADMKGAKDAVEGVGRFFGDHAHDVVGQRKTLSGAKKLAERYIDKWREKARDLPKCDCGEIAA